MSRGCRCFSMATNTLPWRNIKLMEARCSSAHGAQTFIWKWLREERVIYNIYKLYIERHQKTLERSNRIKTEESSIGRQQRINCGFKGEGRVFLI